MATEPRQVRNPDRHVPDRGDAQRIGDADGGKQASEAASRFTGAVRNRDRPPSRQRRNQGAEIERDLEQGQKQDGPEGPVEQDDKGAGKFGCEHGARGEPGPEMILRGHKQQNGRRHFHPEGKGQRPEPVQDDDQAGKSEDKAQMIRFLEAGWRRRRP